MAECGGGEIEKRKNVDDESQFFMGQHRVGQDEEERDERQVAHPPLHDESKGKQQQGRAHGARYGRVKIPQERRCLKIKFK